MVSSYSVIIIGMGIFSFWVISYVSIQTGISLGHEAVESDTNFITTSMILNWAEFGMVIGGTIGISGLFIMAYQFSTSTSFSPERKKVSVFWQIVCSYIPGFDLWAVYRIKKLKYGIMWWVISFAGGYAALYGIIPEIGNPILVSLLSALIYVAFVFKWSRDWNKMLSEKQMPEEDRALFSG